MRVIYNNIIHFKGFKAINLFGIVFARRWLTLQDLNHEAIHTQQMKEMLYVFFYIAHICEWVYNLIKYRDTKLAYYEISFEREAYEHQTDMRYLRTRKHFAQYR